MFNQNKKKTWIYENFKEVSFVDLKKINSILQDDEKSLRCKFEKNYLRLKRKHFYLVISVNLTL